MDRQAILREMKSMLGSTPEFLKRVPDPHLGAVWGGLRDLELQPGKVPAKYQQLIMLAVSRSAKCAYCTEFHLQLAKALGASDEEIMETALLAGHSANLSVIFSGVHVEFEQFKREVGSVCQTLSGNAGKGAKSLIGHVRPPEH